MPKTAGSLIGPTSAVGREVSMAIAYLENGFAAALERGKQGRVFLPDLDVAAGSRLLLTCTYGLSVLGRTTKSKAELVGIAQALITSFLVRRR